jgi:hypothetical protein
MEMLQEQEFAELGARFRGGIGSSPARLPLKLLEAGQHLGGRQGDGALLI